MSPIVSIIIPHLNQNDALDKCISTLRLQTYPLKKLEVIIIDNGSLAIPSIKNDVFKDLLILSEDTPGPGPARNTGVASSNGEYLFFIDADCTADKDWISNGIFALSNDRTAILGGDVKIPIFDKESITSLEAYEMIFAYQQENYIIKQGFSGSGNLAASRFVFDQVGPFPGIEVAEDRAWGAQALAKGYNFTYCSSMIIYHPAREEFSELFQKWARHSRHDFAELESKKWALVKWFWRALMVLGSIPIHSLKVITSDRLKGIGQKSKAIAALAIIRLYRVGFMLRMVFNKNFRNQTVSWNKD